MRRRAAGSSRASGPCTEAKFKSRREETHIEAVRQVLPQVLPPRHPLVTTISPPTLPAHTSPATHSPVHKALHVQVLKGQQHLAGIESHHILLQPLAAGVGGRGSSSGLQVRTPASGWACRSEQQAEDGRAGQVAIGKAGSRHSHGRRSARQRQTAPEQTGTG